jgi:DNA-binding winged helix-turn-helix (wHTH) protein
MKIKIDVERRQVRVEDPTDQSPKYVTLSEKEITILNALQQSEGLPLTREALYHAAWGGSAYFDPSSNIVDVYIYYIRRALRTQAQLTRRQARLLVGQIRGSGYRLNELQDALEGEEKAEKIEIVQGPIPRRGRGRPRKVVASPETETKTEPILKVLQDFEGSWAPEEQVTKPKPHPGPKPALR